MICFVPIKGVGAMLSKSVMNTDLRGRYMKTNRGFELQQFTDDYGAGCSIQESSSVVPHIWLGVDEPDIKIQWKDAVAAGIDVVKDDPGTNEYGWCTINLPHGTLVESRMHLNQEQAETLAKKLLYFAETGQLPEALS